MTLEQAMRWKRLWWFLSMDITSEFAEELWLSFFKPAHKEHIRSSIDPKLDLPTYGSDPRFWIYERIETFRTTFSDDVFRQISLWERDVFVDSGADRISEFIWKSLALERLELNDREISEIFDVVSGEYRTHTEVITQKIARAEMSAWDASAIDADDMTFKDVLGSIGQIASTNVFARIWKLQCTRRGAAFLNRLFEEISQYLETHKDSPFPADTLPFPSSWECDLELVAIDGDRSGI